MAIKSLLGVVSLAFVSLASNVSAAYRLVPYQYATIQEAIDACMDGDVVIVAEGTYAENIVFRGVNITVTSWDPYDPCVVVETVIDGSGQGNCVVFEGGESNACVLEGFTLTRGGTETGTSTYVSGGGILCQDSSPTIRLCAIKGNGVDEYEDIRVANGGGIAIVGSGQPIIENCLITENRAEYRGGGIYLYSDDAWESLMPTIRHCTIAQNQVNWDLQPSGDFEVDARYARPTVENTIIYGDYEHSIVLRDPCGMTFCCVKTARRFEEPDSYVPYDPMMAGGNISVAPRFTVSGTFCINDECIYGDYHIRNDSPCVNAGDPCYVAGAWEVDGDGQDRVMLGRTDVGWDEVHPQVRVVRPMGGEVWTAGSNHEVRWESFLEGNVDVMFSTNGGGDWLAVAEDVANTGTLALELPMGLVSADCVFQVEAHEEPAYVEYEASGKFAIVPYSAGSAVTADWPSLGRHMSRQGLAAASGPELGCLKWEFDPCGPVHQSVTLGAAGRVHVACENGKLYALDPCGQVEWTFEAMAPLLTTPTVNFRPNWR